VRRFRSLFRWLHLGLISITLLSYLAPFVSPAIFWPFAVLGLAFPILLVFNLLFLCWWAFHKDRYFFYGIATILLGWSHLTALVGFSGGAAVAEPALEVMTFNVYGALVWKDKSRIATEQEILALFDQHPVDVVCLQEFPLRTNRKARLQDVLENKLGLRYKSHPAKGSLAIFSRYPIEESGHHFFKNRSNGFQWADILVDGRRIRVFNLHLQSNALTQMAEQVMDEGNLQEPSTWSDIRTMIGRYRRATTLRSKQAEQVNSLIAKSPHPVVLGGDFNEPPTSFVYHTLTRHLRDAFQEAGSGIGVTYAGKVPGLRIDYVLTDPAFQVMDHNILTSSFSDHKAVVATLFLPE
jgi:endonuclease/exonuclease/phosphatase (EEP) superfamily protein YafD